MEMIKLRSKAGQESVWNYPRPSRPAPFTGHLQIVFNGQIIFDAYMALSEDPKQNAIYII